MMNGWMNGSGKLDRQEVEKWILPQDFEHSEMNDRLFRCGRCAVFFEPRNLSENGIDMIESLSQLKYET